MNFVQEHAQGLIESLTMTLPWIQRGNISPWSGRALCLKNGTLPTCQPEKYRRTVGRKNFRNMK